MCSWSILRGDGEVGTRVWSVIRKNPVAHSAEGDNDGWIPGLRAYEARRVTDVSAQEWTTNS